LAYYFIAVYQEKNKEGKKMKKKETIAVVMLCGMTTILKICSIVAIYSHKTYEVKKKRETMHLVRNTMTNDLLLPEERIEILPQYDIKFKYTTASNA